MRGDVPARKQRRVPARWLPSMGASQARGEGANNFGYGPPRAHTHGSVINRLWRYAARPHKPYPTPNHDARDARDEVKREMLAAMTRDELRAICKAQNVVGYGKMNKAELIEAALV